MVVNTSVQPFECLRYPRKWKVVLIAVSYDCVSRSCSFFTFLRYNPCDGRRGRVFQQSLLPGHVDGIFEVYRLNGHRGYQPRYDFFNLGVAEAMINKQPLRHCVFCSKFARCTIPMEYEVYDRYTREKKKVIRQVLNRGVKEDKIDKYDLAKACMNWQLNEAKCQQVISEHRFSEIYTWASEPDDLPE